MRYLSFLIGPLTIIIAFTSCQNNEAGNNKIKEITNNKEKVSECDWADETGMLALNFESDSTISFLDVQGITFEMLNDTLYKITYPEEPVIAELGPWNQFEFDSSSIVWCESQQFNGFVATSSLYGNAFDVNTKDIMFGADRIKTKVLDKEKLKIYFPKESFWKIKSINDPLKCLNFFESGIMVYGKKDTMYYEPYAE